MQRYLLFLLICQLLTVAICNSTEENHNSTTYIDLKSEHLEHRPKLPIFPRNKSKFVVTLKPYVNYYPKEKIMTRMPLMPRVTPASPVTLTTPQMVSRTPITKLRTFTIPSHANGKYNKIEKLAQDFTPVYMKQAEAETQRIITTSTTLNTVTEVHEDPITDDMPEDSVINWKNHQINKIKGNAYDIQQDEKAKVNKPNEESFALEKEDRKEFIFIENINEKQTVNTDMTDSIDQVLDYETTTERNSMEKEVRVKRSKNVIEEENVPTTISGFRYTGYDTMLNNNLYFKNINT